MTAFDAALNNMMNSLHGLNVATDALFSTCDRCNEVVATIDTIELAGRHFHPRCAPVCPKCKRNVNPKEARAACAEEILQLKAQVQKSERALAGIRSMAGLYAQGSKEAAGIAQQQADAEADIRRFSKKIEKLENVGAGVTFVKGSFYHPACFPCSMPDCQNDMPTDEFLHPQTGKPVCRQHFFSLQGLVCTSCSLPIDVLNNESFVTVEGQRFHKPCFKCHHCKKAMVNYRAGPDTKLYCKDCHTRMF